VDLESIATVNRRIKDEVAKAVVGQAETLDLLLVGLLSDGHILLEGVPGTAKTMIVQTFAVCLGLDFGRIQFTPDLMPGDVLGTNLFNFQTNQFVLRVLGPANANK
jgi:MoxR-like ATPase